MVNTYFMKTQCPDCSHEHVVFSRVASDVACHSCGATVAKSTGGETLYKGDLLGKLE